MKNRLFISCGLRTIRSLFAISFVILCCSGISAQVVYPVTVTAQMISGGSVYLGDFANPMATANKLNFTLTLRDPVEAQRTVYLRLTIVQNGTVIASNPAGFRGNQITLEQNVPYPINGEDLAPNLSTNNLSGLSGPFAYGVLNEGVTDICLEVIDAFREEPVSSRACATGYLARLQSPILILPVDGQNLFESQLNNLVFTWQMTDPLAHLPLANIDYLFELREKSPLLDAQDQFENHTLIYSTTVGQFSVFYNELASQLDPSTTYIWRVTARFYDQSGNPAPNYFVNNGVSRIGLFQVLPDLVINSGESGVSCFCPNGECDVMFPANTDPSRNLVVGDSVRFGAFYMKINEMDGSGANGIGSIRIPFLNSNVSVGFDNIRINDQFEVTQGQVSALASQLVSAIGVDSDALPDLSALTIGADWLADMNQHVSEVRESMSLPLSLGNKLALLGFSMPFDVFVTDIDFNAYGAATVNLLMSIPGSGGQICNFGATGIRIGRNGFDMAGLKLYLLSDMTIPGLSSLPLVIRKAVQNDPSLGSYIAFGCNGLEQFNLQCSYIFPQSQLRRVDNVEEPVVADLTLRSGSWGQFTGYGRIDDFSITGAPGWNFSANNIILDLDQFSNPPEISFPEDYTSPGNEWKGFYIDRIAVELPEDISLAGGNTSVFSANNIILDKDGMTGRAEGVNVLDISTGSVGGWAYSIDSISLNIFKNSFVDAHIAGKVGIGVLEAEIDYQGLIFRDAQDNYSFNLSPVGSFGIPYLMLSASIDEGSVLAIEKQPGTNEYKPFADLNMTVEVKAGEEDFRSAGVGSLVDELKGMLDIEEFNFGVTGIKFNHFKINHPDLPYGKHFALESIDGGAVVIPGLPDIQLSDLQLLEQVRNFNGTDLPALGVDIQMHLGLASVGVGVWAKEDNSKPDGGYKFGKFEIKLPDFSGMSFKCACIPPADTEGEAPKPDYCTAPPLTGGAIIGIQPDDRIRVGHFVMRVEEANGNSGKGKMEIPFLGILLDVAFENIAIHKMANGEKRLVGGVVESVANAALGGFNVGIAETEGPLDLNSLDVTDEFMSQMGDLSSGEGGFFSMPFSIRQKMDAMFGVTLPEGFDFILLGLQFGPERARLNAMLTFKLPGETYMKFGLSGMNIRPDGFNMDGIQIYLTEDITIQN